MPILVLDSKLDFLQDRASQEALAGMWSWETVVGIALGVLGLGVMAGQGFHPNGWVWMFWAGAALLLVVRALHRLPNVDTTLDLVAEMDPNPESHTAGAPLAGLSATIDMMTVLRFTHPDPRKPEIPFLKVIASIRNTGVPTIAENFGLRLHLADGAVLVGKQSIIPGGGLQADDGTPVLHAADALYNKTLTPIPNGGLARGVLVYVFEGATRETLRPPVTRKAVMTFRDGFGRPHETVLENIVKFPDGLSFPGLTH